MQTTYPRSHDTLARRGRSPGQALVEFALLLPVLMFVFLGAVDLGRVFLLTVSLQNAAREGAVFGSASPTCASAIQCANPGNITYVARQEMGGDTQLAVAVACSPACAATPSGGNPTVTVRVSRPFTFITPFIGSIFGGALTPAASATAVIR